MDCRELREHLHAAVDGELEAQAMEAFHDHVAECPGCAGQAESARRLKRLVQVKARRTPPPPGLEDRIREEIAREESIPAGAASTSPGAAPPGEPTRTRVWQVRGSLAAAVVIVIALGVWLPDYRPAIVHADIVAQAERSHHDILHGDPTAIPLRSCDARRACSEILDTDVTLPAFDRSDVQLRRVSAEHFGPYAGAHLLYQRGAVQFSVFAMHAPKVVPGPRVERGGPFLIEGLVCCCKRGKEFSVLCYRLDDTYLCFVVNEDAEKFYEELLAEALKK